MRIPANHADTQRKRTMAAVALSPVHNQGADLSQWCGAVFNQLQEGSCTACETRDHLLWKQNRYGYVPVTDPNVQILYYFGRKVFGDLNSDNGATIHDAHYAAINNGVWPASVEAYNKSTLFTVPSGDPTFNASEQQDLQPTTANIRASLDSGVPVGVAVEVDRTLFNPTLYDGMHIADVTTQVLGEGHALFIPTYKTDPAHGYLYKYQNSWGEGYGDKGFAWFTEAYLQKYLYELGTLDIPQPRRSVPTPDPLIKISATFAYPLVKVGTNNQLTLTGMPGAHFDVSVSSPALPRPLGLQGTFDESGFAKWTVSWPAAGDYTYAITSDGQTVMRAAVWQ